MALTTTLVWLCSLAALSVSDDHIATAPKNCTLNSHLYNRLSADLQEAAECGEALPSALGPQQAAAMLLSMRNLTELLHRRQLTDCQAAKPRKCPDPEVHSNGGLVCVTVANKRYCKPMCNHGYDFAFLRRSRLFDECSKQTGHKWNTQYVGGNRLAVCQEASIQVAGPPTAYFPQGQDCLTVKSQSHNSLIRAVIAELQSQGVEGEPESSCLLCG